MMDQFIMQSDKKRIFWMDVARTIAIITVCLNHAMDSTFSIYSGAYKQFTEYSSPILSLIESALYLISRFGVPIFLMLSGALLLKRDYSEPKNLKKFIVHNWLPLFIASEIWFTIYYWFLQTYPDGTLATLGWYETIQGWVHTLFFFDQETMINMWYMRMILLSYLLIPVFSIAVKKIHKKYILTLAILTFVLTFVMEDIDTINACLSIDKVGFQLKTENLLSYCMAYILLGYYLNEGLTDKIKTWVIALLWAGAFALGTYYTYRLFGCAAGKKLEYTSSASIVTAILTFELIRRLGGRLRCLRKPCTYISRISFGIFFVHIIINTYLEKTVFATREISPFTGTPLYLCASFVGAVVIVAILSLIPLFRKHFFVIK